MTRDLNFSKSPFPWAGGKSKAAPLVWELLGDVAHYVEPFAGSMAVLLNRPHEANRTYYSETVNDLDGLLVNAWRAIALHPEATADAASWPVSEADLHARHVALIQWRADRQLEHLMGDPLWCDPMMAGWWLWGVSCWIGSGWCADPDGNGPWWPDADDRLTDFGRRGTADPSTRRPLDGEPGVSRQRPHLGDNGQGVNRPQLREPGVSRQLPHLTSDGQGVNRPQLREPGVSRQLPHLGNDGQGVNRPQLREPGVEFHELTMPELTRWFRFLSARLRHVRICNGDWKRVLGPSASKTLPVRGGKGHAGIFLDPPYSAEAGRAEVYAVEDFGVAHAVRDWCLKHGDDPEYRIVLAGFEGEGHEALEAAGWSVHEWFAAGWLQGGYGQQNQARGHQQARERLWASPHCLPVGGTAVEAPLSLFDQWAV